MMSRGAVLALLLTFGAMPVLAQEPRRLDLLVVGGAVAADQRVIKAVRGEKILLRVASDRPGALHLHGYDIELALAPGAAAEATVSLRAAGRFAAYFHAADEKPSKRHGPALFHLDVLPK